MKRLLLFVLMLLALGVQAADEYRQGMVAAVHHLASEAGVEAMRQGGNAVDAAVVTGLVLGVVDSHNSGIGGGCFMLIRRPDGEIVALDGRETAPAAATADMFVRNGHAVDELSRTGALAVAVPGQVAVFYEAVTRYGKLPWKVHCEMAAKIAEDGFPVPRAYASRLASVAGDLAKFPSSRAIFLHADGTPLQEGEMHKQPELAKALRSLGAGGADWFYRGPFAQATAKWMRENGGLITEADFAAYAFQRRTPLETTYHGHRIVGMPPPSSGGVHVAQILNILEAKGAGKPEDFTHTVAEAMKLAFADRAFWLGDPAFTKVPRGLADKEYGRSLAAKIDVTMVTPVKDHGTPPRADEHVFEKHTTHFSSADVAGNWVACTSTINTSYGSKIVVPGMGVVLNNEMDDFAAEPGAPNAFGLVGAEANLPAPGKRPLSSMSPTIVFDGQRPILAIGAAGGPTIISQTLLSILHILDEGDTPAQALARPRFHQQWSPDELRVEKSMPEAMKADLRRRGHVLNEVEFIGSTQAVGQPEAGGPFIGAHDPRSREGRAVGW
ncbi:MAG: gamma-glutamyltransferase [Verrucomicrobiota bacterium]